MGSLSNNVKKEILYYVFVEEYLVSSKSKKQVVIMRSSVESNIEL